MKIGSYSCRAAGLLIVGMILTVVSPGCTRNPIINPEEVWPEVFPSAQEMRLLPMHSDPDNSDRLYVLAAPEDSIGHAVEKEVVSRSGPFRIMVFIDTEVKVKRVIILHYPYMRGRNVQKPQFRRQFEGKGPDDPIRLGEDIDAMTGATISSRVVTAGVRESVQRIQSITGNAREQ